MKIIKSKTFKPNETYITPFLNNDLKRMHAFKKGEAIEVSKEELEIFETKGWGYLKKETK